MARKRSSLETDFASLCERQPDALVARYQDIGIARSWTIGRKKPFAVWYYGKGQSGPHVRSNDARLRADARIKPSTIHVHAMELTNNFVWLDPGAQWSSEELGQIIAASASLATRKDGGIKRGGEFADLFIALRKALVATPPHMRPPPPYHASGPAAKILGNEGPTSRALAVWAARKLEPPPEERAKYDRALDLAERKGGNYQALWAGYYDKGGSPALRAARAAQLAHGSMAGGFDTRASSYAAECVCLVVETLVAQDAAAKTRAFIEEVDDRILNAELSAVARVHTAREDVTCERVLWRGATRKGTRANGSLGSHVANTSSVRSSGRDGSGSKARAMTCWRACPTWTSKQQRKSCCGATSLGCSAPEQSSQTRAGHKRRRRRRRSSPSGEITG
jgi:hypothetical protein